jgi:hypothetical protein
LLSEIFPKDIVYDPSDHPSLIEIKKQNDCTNKFVFEKVTTDTVEKIINKSRPILFPQINVLKSMFSLIFFSIWLQNFFAF